MFKNNLSSISNKKISIYNKQNYENILDNNLVLLRNNS